MLAGWFGMPGALMRVTPYRGDVTESDDRAVSELRSLSGARHVQIGAGSARSWSLALAGAPGDLAPLRFASVRPGPWVWVSPAAQSSNLLTPGQSMFEGPGVAFSGGASVRTGALHLGGTSVAQWAGGPPGGVISVTSSRRVAVRAGVPVNVSAWTQRADPGSSTRMVYAFWDATGANIGGETLSGPSGTTLRRADWTVTPPDGAADMSISFRNAAVVAGPQVAWASSPGPYADGRGVHRVVVTDWSEGQDVVLPDGSLWLSASLKIMEVG